MDEVAIAALVAALASLVVAIGGVLKIVHDIRQVHTIVNSQRTEMMAEIERLKAKITADSDAKRQG